MKHKILKGVKPTYLVIALAAGLALMVLSNTFTPHDKEEPTPEIIEGDVYNTDAEKRLEQILESIDGVSNVKVFITYENRGVKKIASVGDSSSSDDGNKKTDTASRREVTVKNNSGESPFVDEEILPQVRGVIIAADGLENEVLSAEITDAVSAVLGVSVNRVKILSNP